jgi:hypothetical protein
MARNGIQRNTKRRAKVEPDDNIKSESQKQALMT